MGKIGFLFAGQGSQYTGMGRDLYDTYTYAKDVFNIARSIRPDMLEIMWQANDNDELNQTENTQIAVFTVDMAVAKVLYEMGIVPNGVAGFSLGEMAALCFAKVFDIRTGLQLVDKRARAMQKCCLENGGTMVAVLRLTTEKVQSLVNNFKDAWCVNFNSPEQTVVACSNESAEKFMCEVLKQGGRAVKLKVSGAFHSPFMNDASATFSTELDSKKLEKCALPVYANLTACPYDSGITEDGNTNFDYKNMMAKQVNNPVKWQNTIQNMLSDGFTTFIEVGPGNVLSGLVKKICDAKGRTDIKVYGASDCKSIENIMGELK